jgi:hypothetical protein
MPAIINQIQFREYPSSNRNGYRPAKPLQPAPYAPRTISADTIFPDSLVLLTTAMEKEKE